MISKDDVVFKLDQAFCAQIEKLFSVLHANRIAYKNDTSRVNAVFAAGLRELIETRRAAEECVHQLFADKAAIGQTASDYLHEIERLQRLLAAANSPVWSEG